MISGIVTALITPFKSDFSIDKIVWEKMVLHQKKAGVHGLCIAGSTGEGGSLDDDELVELVTIARQVVGKDYPLIVGMNGYNTKHMGEKLSKLEDKIGGLFDSWMIAPPYYVKPAQEGVYGHYHALASASSLPIIIYNIPGRTNVDITNETLVRLAKEQKKFIGLKDCSGDITRLVGLRKQLGDTFNVMVGDDPLALPYFLLGANGLISVVSNLMPELVVKLWDTAQDGNISAAREVNKRLYLLYNDLFKLGTNPQPIKAALSHIGIMENVLRLPLTPLGSDAMMKINKILKLMEYHAP